MMRLTDPLHEGRDAPIYTPEEAAKQLTKGGDKVVVIPSSTQKGRAFATRLDNEFDEKGFLVGSWQEELWLLISVEDIDRARDIADEVGGWIGDTGPIADYSINPDSERDDRVHFPIERDDFFVFGNVKKGDDQ